MREIHQVLPTIMQGDAIGNEAIEIHKTLNRWGYRSEIYAEHIHPSCYKIAKRCTKLFEDPSAVLLYHYSIGSEFTSLIHGLPNPLGIIYHNITPYNYFVGINESMARLLKKGREELSSLRDRASIALADSEFNRQELVQLGFRNTAVLPILIDFSRYAVAADREMIDKYDDDSVKMLFVGRFTPNKKLDEIMKVFGYYQKCIDSDSRLFLVGSYLGAEVYCRFLVGLVRKFGLHNVHFVTDRSGGPSKTSELVASYQMADVFITMSEHEGFCVPLIESMHFGLPIVAYSAAAIPFVLDGAGILISDKNYAEIAEFVQIVVEDQALRRRIVEKQYERLQIFSREKVEASLRSFLNQLSRWG